MIYFIVRILVNAVVFAITISILPGFQISPLADSTGGAILSFLGTGLVLAIANSLVRPVVLFITSHLYISHMVLMVLVTNCLILLLVGFFSPSTWYIEDIFWIIPAAVIMAFTTLILESAFGLDSPVIDETHDKRNPFYWRWLASLPTGRRNRLVENLRLRQVHDTIWRYGVNILFDRTPFAGFRHFMQRLIYRRRKVLIGESAAVNVRMMLQELGPTYVKVGQMVSSRAEALPEDWKIELSKLQNDVPPFPWDQAREILIGELHDTPENLFTSFDTTPFAAASTAQVHRATLKDGQCVVVKVQRPEIVMNVRTDLNIMSDVVAFLEKHNEFVRNNDVPGVLDEFAANVMMELDYTNEAYNARRLAHNMADIKGVHVPTIFGSYSTSRVLTMEFIAGVKITNVAAIDSSGHDRVALAQTFVQAMIKQVIFDGFFHGDPHPGNVFFNPTSGEIIFLDLGMMGEITREQRFDLANLIWSFHQKDSYGLAQTMIKLSVQMRPVDLPAFYRDIDHLIQRHMVYAQEDTRLSSMMSETLSTMYKHGLRMNHDLTIGVKALMQAEEIVSALSSNLGMVDTAFSAVQTLLVEQINPENVSSLVMEQVSRTARGLVNELPALQEATMRWLLQYKQGRFNVNVNVESDVLMKNTERLNYGLERLTVSLLLIGLLIGSGLAVTTPHVENWVDLPILASLVFLGAGGLSLLLVWRMLRDLGQRTN